MLPDRVSYPGPLTYESGALPIALRSPAISKETTGRNNGNKFAAYNSAADAIKTAERIVSNSYSDQPAVRSSLAMGPVVRSIVSLTISLRGQLIKCLMTI